MSIYITIKSSYYGGIAEVIGVFGSKDKAEEAASQHMTEVDGWYQKGSDEWQNDGYEWHMTIQEHEVK